MAIVKAYPLTAHRPDGHSWPRQNLRQKRTQSGQCGGRRLRRRRSAHRRTYRGIQHPEREFLRPTSRSFGKAAACNATRAAIHHLMNVNRVTRPRMPTIGDDGSVAPVDEIIGAVGLVS